MRRPSFNQLVTIPLAAFVVAFGLYTLFWPVPVVRYLTDKIAVEERQVRAGTAPTLHIRYCEGTDLNAHVVGTLYQGGRTVNALGEKERDYQNGCPVETRSSVWQIPADTPPGGGYSICFNVTYTVNAFRQPISRHICTTEFEVIR